MVRQMVVAYAHRIRVAHLNLKHLGYGPRAHPVQRPQGGGKMSHRARSGKTVQRIGGAGVGAHRVITCRINPHPVPPPIRDRPKCAGRWVHTHPRRLITVPRLHGGFPIAYEHVTLRLERLLQGDALLNNGCKNVTVQLVRGAKPQPRMFPMRPA